MKTPVEERIMKGGILVSRALLVALGIGGIIVTGAVAPNLLGALKRLSQLKEAVHSEDEREQKKKALKSFAYLLKRGLVKKEYRGRQLYISLSPLGRKMAKKYRIDFLNIARMKRWDGKWRMVLFDIEEDRKVTREALRGKLKELGFFQIQKSVWVHAFPCEEELSVLQQFFDLQDAEFMCFEVRGLPKVIKESAKKHFQLP